MKQVSEHVFLDESPWPGRRCESGGGVICTNFYRYVAWDEEGNDYLLCAEHGLRWIKFDVKRPGGQKTLGGERTGAGEKGEKVCMSCHARYSGSWRENHKGLCKV